MSLPYTLELNIPFETFNQAAIAKNTLSPDPILRSDELTIDYATDSNNLKVKFSGVSDRVIRVAISNMIDNIKTIIECMDEFDGKKINCLNYKIIRIMDRQKWGFLEFNLVSWFRTTYVHSRGCRTIMSFLIDSFVIV